MSPLPPGPADRREQHAVDARPGWMVMVWRRARRLAGTWVRRAGNALGSRVHRAHRLRPHVVGVCVYRCTNEPTVRALVDGLGQDAEIRLHCLDGPPPPGLAPMTVRSGPGHRTQLLQTLLDQAPIRPGSFVLICDDDVQFVAGPAAEFVAIAAGGGLDIAQPAHRRGSLATYAVNGQAALSTARLTTYVEVGPVVLLSPAARRLVLPFPREYRMGWGLDVLWTQLREGGLRLGVVDATPVHHAGAIGAGYAREVEEDLLDRALRQIGATSVDELAATVGRPWRPWRRTPPWLDRP